MIRYIALALLCLLNIERTVSTTTNTTNKHVFYKGSEDFIKIPDDDIELLFNGLDRNKNGKIGRFDLLEIFKNPHAEEDVFKFLREADSDDPDVDVDLPEFKEFMSDVSVVWAIAGCKNPRKTKKLKLHCYQDYFITYVHIMLTFEEVMAFFSYFDTDGNGKITKSDVRDKIILKHQNVTEEVFDAVLTNIMHEWGNDDYETDFPEFKSYVRQEDFTIDIRGCSSGSTDCYKDHLISYSTHFLTELLIVSMFQNLDQQKDGKITSEEITKYTLNPQHFFKTVSTEYNAMSVTFEEFRLFTKKVVIKDMLEENCQDKFIREDKIECSCSTLFQITKFAYRLAKIIIPHSDHFYMFEELDSDKNGDINDNELARFESNEIIRKNILLELDTSQTADPNAELSINFDEFTYYLSFPSFVYALSPCLYIPETEQTKCFIEAFIEFAGHMMRTGEMLEFFQSYTTRGSQVLNRDDISPFIPNDEFHDEDLNNFITELGMGDDEITTFEFASYVRHLDLREKFQAAKTVQEKQAILLDYIQNRMTEYDIEVVFEYFDTNGNYEIDVEDFTEEDDNVHKFLKALDTDDGGVSIDFKEFRYFCVKPEIRAQLEEDCTEKHRKQEDEIDCYQGKIWTMTTEAPTATEAASN